jgi:mRNA interferase MazF
MFEAGTIVTVPYPFTDQRLAKRRPVLALTSPDSHGDFIGCPMTSRDRWINARPVLPTDLIEGALPLMSWVRSDRVVTLNADLVVARIARTAEGFRRAVANDLCRFIENASDPTPP